MKKKCNFKILRGARATLNPPILPSIEVMKLYLKAIEKSGARQMWEEITPKCNQSS